MSLYSTVARVSGSQHQIFPRLNTMSSLSVTKTKHKTKHYCTTKYKFTLVLKYIHICSLRECVAKYY